jgi:predicted GH43/DUF377 family glycosyl hydrolase
MMKWRKKGMIFNVSGENQWMNSHAQIPTVLVKDKALRIYFATRSEPHLSMTTFVDVDINDPKQILYVHDKPILELGKPGMFDEQGIMPTYVCEHQNQVWLYYGGWSRRTIIPYSNWTGLAVSDDGGTTFQRAFPGPIMDRTPLEIYSATASFILREKEQWHMWYASGEGWIKVSEKYEEYYVIKHAYSNDGITWVRENKQILPSKSQYEPTHRPSVFFRNGKYHLYFCFRGISDFRDGENSYRMGYAWSTNLVDWTRDDAQGGLVPSLDGWDSKMMAYPYIVNVKGKILMFYNGNGFGQTGFGYAELEND